MSRERTTDDIKIEQQAPLNLDNLSSMSDRPAEIVRAEGFTKEYADQLDFNEQPVTVMISPEGGRNSASWVQAWSCGTSEYFENGRWVPAFKGYLPTGRRITLKRRLVEVLLRARVTSVSTNHDAKDSQGNPINQVIRETAAVNPIQIFNDNGPGAQEWFEKTMGRNF